MQFATTCASGSRLIRSCKSSSNPVPKSTAHCDISKNMGLGERCQSFCLVSQEWAAQSKWISYLGLTDWAERARFLQVETGLACVFDSVTVKVVNLQHTHHSCPPHVRVAVFDTHVYWLHLHQHQQIVARQWSLSILSSSSTWSRSISSSNKRLDRSLCSSHSGRPPTFPVQAKNKDSSLWCIQAFNRFIRWT